MVTAGLGMSSDSNGGDVELQELLSNADGRNVIDIQEMEHLVISVDNNERTSGGDIEEVKEDVGETSP